MSTPPPPTDALWRTLAEQQQASVDEPLRLRAAERALSERLFAPRRRRWPYVGAALAGAGTLAVLLLVVRAQPLRFRVEPSGEEGQSGRTFTAGEKSELPLQFSDGSQVIFQPSAAGRVQRLTGAGAEVVLERGRLDAHVVHRADTIWLVRAGKYAVRVTGTRFSVVWSVTSLAVTVREGSVIVEGTLNGAGVPLHAGQRLTVDVASGRVRTMAATDGAGESQPTGADPDDRPRVSSAPEIVEAPLAAGPPARPTLTSPPRQPPASGGRALAPLEPSADWVSLADRGAYDQAFVIAQRIGFASLRRSADAMALLRLGDVARYAGAPREARLSFEALVARFPAHELTPDATFSLGRLAFEGGQPEVAARWFRQYLERWPHARFSDQAAGRLIECALQAGDPAAARAAARAYLERSPNGAHVGLARRALDETSDQTGGHPARNQP